MVTAGRKFICLTVDDGYRDNVDIALPILCRHDAPATIFVPSGVIDRTLDAWWLQVEEMAKQYPDPPRFYRHTIAEFTKNPDALERARRSFPACQIELNDRYFMNSTEIKNIAANPLIDIGGHTVTHPFLKRLPEERAWHEIRQNKDDLEELLGRSVETFAYPFGDAEACDEREFRLVERAGYKVAVTTRVGNVFACRRNAMTDLPRYSVHGHTESVEVYDMQNSGIYFLLKSGFKSALGTG